MSKKDDAEKVEEPDWGPTPRVPPDGPTLTLEQQTQLERLQVDFPHDMVQVEWDEKGEEPTFVTPDGDRVKAS